mmetsp:Transcript_96321/g.244758  ORF Transcript_96321/g.244758 Transcript_96321/m.244758 type:complete len:306 (-) Transcript_96321:165-1082(-)
MCPVIRTKIGFSHPDQPILRRRDVASRREGTDCRCVADGVRGQPRLRDACDEAVDLRKATFSPASIDDRGEGPQQRQLVDLVLEPHLQPRRGDLQRAGLCAVGDAAQPNVRALQASQGTCLHHPSVGRLVWQSSSPQGLVKPSLSLEPVLREHECRYDRRVRFAVGLHALPEHAHNPSLRFLGVAGLREEPHDPGDFLELEGEPYATHPPKPKLQTTRIPRVQCSRGDSNEGLLESRIFNSTLDQHLQHGLHILQLAEPRLRGRELRPGPPEQPPLGLGALLHHPCGRPTFQEFALRYRPRIKGR